MDEETREYLLSLKRNDSYHYSIPFEYVKEVYDLENDDVLMDTAYIVHFNEEELREINRLVANISNNINQIILHVSRDDDSFDSDIAEIKEKMNRIWQPLNFFQAKVLQLKH